MLVAHNLHPHAALLDGAVHHRNHPVFRDAQLFTAHPAGSLDLHPGLLLLLKDRWDRGPPLNLEVLRLEA